MTLTYVLSMVRTVVANVADVGTEMCEADQSKQKTRSCWFEVVNEHREQKTRANGRSVDEAE